MKYLVAREHLGDRPYARGDEREAAPAEVMHLVRAGVLLEAKVEPPLETKQASKGRGKK